MDPLTKIEVFEVDPIVAEVLCWLVEDTNRLWENWQLSLNNMKRQLRRKGLPFDQAPTYDKPQDGDTINGTYWKSLNEMALLLRSSIESYLRGEKNRPTETIRSECQRMLDLVDRILGEAADWLGVKNVEDAPAVSSERLKGLLKSFLDDLEGIAAAHPELYDTDVGDQLSEALVRHYVKASKRTRLPHSFGMFSEEANTKVRDALLKFISKAKKIAAEEGINEPRSRLSTIQDDSVSTEKGECYDVFFGHLDFI
ncbi:MAG: hypothetical protein GX589_00525 [Deltaproteobacteria bacterium]|nr:hypothetical protein [Deltaproteobacteria bacterium]